jgi:glycosyltransferase involved in cell wall biosynthesis
MKITFISLLQAYWGGSEVLWSKCAELAKAEGHDVQVVVYGQNTGFHPEVQKLKSIADSFVALPNYQAKASVKVKVLRKIKEKLKPFKLTEVNNFNPDCIIISQETSYSAPFHPLLYPYLISTAKPFYLIAQFNSDHQVFDYGDILKARAIFGKAKNIFFVSRRNMEMAEIQIAKKIPNGKVIDNHPSVSKLKQVAYPATKEVLHLASVARLEAEFKGQDILLQVFSGKQWRNRNWHLNFYGTGKDEQFLKDLTAHYQLDDKVTFHGHVSNIGDVWKHNHALVMPSVAEGKPLALIEAMMCGRVGIVSDVAGNAELVDDAVNGFVATSYYAGPFSEALERAWMAKELWQEMGEKAHQKIVDIVDFYPHKTILETVLKDQ